MANDPGSLQTQRSAKDFYASPLRLAVSGAAGKVGHELLFQIAAGEMFGQRQPIVLSCLDLPDRQSSLEVRRAQLHEFNFPLLTNCEITADPDKAFEDADWIILLASRTDHASAADHRTALEFNGAIYREHGQSINRTAPRARILVVGNPTHTNCLIAMNNAPNLPRERWFALNRTYRLRAMAAIAQKLHVPMHFMNRIDVWGNPGARMYVDFHNSFVGDVPAWQLLRDETWEHKSLQRIVGSRPEPRLPLPGCTSASSAAQAIMETVQAIRVPTAYMHRFGAGVASDGSYGVPDGLVYSFPIRTDDGQKWEIVQDLFHDEFAEERLESSTSELQDEAVLAAPFFGNIL